MPTDEARFAALKKRLAHLRYLLVVPIPWFRHADGSIWIEGLWARDLVRHLDYLTQLDVLAPERPMPDPAPKDLVRLSARPEGLRFRNLTLADSPLVRFLSAPLMALQSFRAVRSADVVHSGVIGWPLPPGLFINPLSVLLRKPLIIYIESTPWRLDAGGGGAVKRFMLKLTERLAHWSVRRAAITFFTHQGYARDFGDRARGEIVVCPATWIDEHDIIDARAAEDGWDRKPPSPRFIVASRLIEAKGVLVVLRALESLDAAGRAVELDVIGEGPLSGAVDEAAARLRTVRLRRLDPVPYGQPFFELLRGYHAVVVPSYSEEQPRILFDAFSQAVPAIASDTAGHREAVSPGATGVLFAPNDPAALAEALDRADAAELRRLGLSAREWVGGRTHQAMHLARAEDLARVLA